MKKFFGVAAAAGVFAALAVSASAANQAGTPVLYTETEAYINGVVIDAYNADDHTVVNVDALRAYGFNVDNRGSVISIAILDDDGIGYKYADAWIANAANRPVYTGNHSAYAGQVYQVTRSNGPTVYINGTEVPSYSTSNGVYVQFKDLVLADDIHITRTDANVVISALPPERIVKGFNAAQNKSWINIDGASSAANTAADGTLTVREGLDKAIASLNRRFSGLEIPWSGTDYLAAYGNEAASTFTFPVHDVATGVPVGTITISYATADQDEAIPVVLPDWAVVRYAR